MQRDSLKKQQELGNQIKPKVPLRGNTIGFQPCEVPSASVRGVQTLLVLQARQCRAESTWPKQVGSRYLFQGHGWRQVARSGLWAYTSDLFLRPLRPAHACRGCRAFQERKRNVYAKVHADHDLSFYFQGKADCTFPDQGTWSSSLWLPDMSSFALGPIIAVFTHFTSPGCYPLKSGVLSPVFSCLSKKTAVACWCYISTRLGRQLLPISSLQEEKIMSNRRQAH